MKNKNHSTATIHYLRVKDVARRLSVSTATIWRMTKDGKLPQPKKITASITAWSVTDIEAWEQGL